MFQLRDASTGQDGDADGSFCYSTATGGSGPVSAYARTPDSAAPIFNDVVYAPYLPPASSSAPVASASNALGSGSAASNGRPLGLPALVTGDQADASRGPTLLQTLHGRHQDIRHLDSAGISPMTQIGIAKHPPMSAPAVHSNTSAAVDPPRHQSPGRASPAGAASKAPEADGRDLHTSSSLSELSSSQEPADPRPPETPRAPMKSTASELRAGSSIPAGLTWEEFARQSVLAAYSSRLHPFALHPAEFKLLRESITQPQVTIYLNIRNAILRLWTKNPLVHVTLAEAAGCARAARYFKLAEVAYHWLLRNGYINFGCAEVPTGVTSTTPAKARATPRRVVVVGAGIAGLGCARQLEGLFAQLGEHWTAAGEQPPSAVVLEARPRIGGRVYSHPLRDQERDLLPQGHRCTAEMGAQIVTGFENGNPMNILIRGQLGLPYHALKDNTVLYDYNGALVEQTQDTRIEKLYNMILERASIYRSKPKPVRTVEGDRNLMLVGREPSGDGGALISTLEEEAASALPSAFTDTVNATEEKPSLGVEKLAGRAYQLHASSNLEVPAAEAATAMGWLLRPDVRSSNTIDLDRVAKLAAHPTLGATMDEGIRQYQRILDLLPQDLRLLNWHHANLEYANAVNVNELSLSDWDQDIGNEFEGAHCEIIGGYQQVARGLWHCPQKLDVRFDCAVKSIHTESDGSGLVKIECANGQTFEADRVVLTPSLGVLKSQSIHFAPSLPSWKLDAIERLGFGLLNKVVLVFAEAFWEPDRDMFGLLNEAEQKDSVEQADYARGRGHFYLFWNCIRTSGRPTLVALMAGDAAHYVESSTDESLVAEVVDRLSKIFAPTRVPQPSETIVTRWKRDPFARGSYSFVGPLTQVGDYDVMAQPCGRLHFAGEATCGTHPATVHGAYLSGLRAAGEVVETMVEPIQVSSPLVEKRARAEPAEAPDNKRKLAAEAAQQQQQQQQQRRREERRVREDYEASVVAAIVEQLGERPTQPTRTGVNPFLLYAKDKWYACKAECDGARRSATGDGDAKASKHEVRSALGHMWRSAPADVKQPYLDQQQSAREALAASAATFKERVAAWDGDAARVRRDYMLANPPPAGMAADGRRSVEVGGKRMRRA